MVKAWKVSTDGGKICQWYNWGHYQIIANCSGTVSAILILIVWMMPCKTQTIYKLFVSLFPISTQQTYTACQWNTTEKKKKLNSAFSRSWVLSNLYKDERTRGCHLSETAHVLKVFHFKRQPMWQMMYVFLQFCDYQLRAVVQHSSPHQFQELCSNMGEVFALRWLLTFSEEVVFCCNFGI